MKSRVSTFLATFKRIVDDRVIGERSEAVLQTAVPGHDAYADSTRVETGACVADSAVKKKLTIMAGR